MQHWADPSVIARIGKWRDERQVQRPLLLGKLFSQKRLVNVSDYLLPSFATLDIIKKPRLFSNALLPFGDELSDARVDAYVDSQSLVQDWQSQAASQALILKH